MAQAARIVLEKTDCECIDINGGCPVPKIVKTGAGSMLSKEPDRLLAIVSSVKKSVEEYCSEHPQRKIVPVTVKIRSGWDSSSIMWKECTQAALEARADAITIHARTRAQGYSGKADWNLQAEMVDFVAGRIPVFGSGDAFTPEDAKRMLEETRCDAVMFARGAMGDPFLFSRTIQYLTKGSYETETPKERIAAGFRELAINIEEQGELGACLQMRKKFCAYSSGLQGGARLRARIVEAKTQEEYKSIFEQYI